MTLKLLGILAMTLSLTFLKNTEVLKENQRCLPVSQESLVHFTELSELPLPVHEKNSVHQALEIITHEGAAIRSYAMGMVHQVFQIPGKGMSVVINHNSGFQSIYQNLDQASVKEGSLVKMGQEIGTAGHAPYFLNAAVVFALCAKDSHSLEVALRQ